MSQTDSRPFWLGLIGGLLGIAAALFAIFFGSLGTAFDPSAGYDMIIGLGFAALLFSVLLHFSEAMQYSTVRIII